MHRDLRLFNLLPFSQVIKLMRDILHLRHTIFIFRVLRHVLLCVRFFVRRKKELVHVEELIPDIRLGVPFEAVEHNFKDFRD